MGTVLIVDDSPDIRILLGQAIRLEGYEVLLAENGKVAQGVIEGTKRPCLVILDLMMPIMDGWEFLDWKNSQPQLAEIPVLVTSAVANPPSNLMGTVGFIKKPLDLGILLNLIENHCECL